MILRYKVDNERVINGSGIASVMDGKCLARMDPSCSHTANIQSLLKLGFFATRYRYYLEAKRMVLNNLQAGSL